MSFTFAKPGGQLDETYKKLAKRDGYVFWELKEHYWMIRVWRLEFVWWKKEKR